MAFLNRDEVKAKIQAATAVVGETEYKAQLDDNFADSVVFRKDVADADTAGAATKTLDFLDIDYISVTQSTNVTYTLSNVQQGEIKYLKITKSAGQTIAFSAATDVSIRQSYINITTTEVIYKITNKDGNLFVESINIDNGHVESIVFEIGDWDMDTLGTANITHGLDLTKIIGIESVIIRNDSDSARSLLYGETAVGGAGGFANVNATQIALQRIAGGMFDSASFGTTPYNRGFVIVKVIQ